MIHRIRIVSVAILLAASGCAKEDLYFVSGLLTDPNLQVPVSGATVRIWTQKIESGIFTANYKLVGEFVTAADGKFSFKLANATYTGVRLVFSHSGYFGWESQVNTAELSKDQAFFKEYQMLPKAWLRIHVVNGEPFNEADFFEYRILNAYTACEECCQEGARQYYGMAIDQTSECMTSGHQDILIQWSKRKNKIQDVRTESFFVTAFDTTRIELVY
jgi:hypothetical protein